MEAFLHSFISHLWFQCKVSKFCTRCNFNSICNEVAFYWFVLFVSCFFISRAILDDALLPNDMQYISWSPVGHKLVSKDNLNLYSLFCSHDRVAHINYVLGVWGLSYFQVKYLNIVFKMAVGNTQTFLYVMFCSLLKRHSWKQYGPSILHRNLVFLQ